MRNKKILFFSIFILFAIFMSSQTKQNQDQQTIIDEWNIVKIPAAPQLTRVTPLILKQQHY